MKGKERGDGKKGRGEKRNERWGKVVIIQPQQGIDGAARACWEHALGS